MNETTTYMEDIPQAANPAPRPEPMRSASAALEAIEKNPLPFIAGAVLLGLLIGSAVAIPSMHKTKTERYLEEPLEDIKDMLGRLTKAVQHGASDAMDGAESRANDTFKFLKSAIGKLR